MASEMRSALKVKTPGRAAEDVDPTRLKLLDTAETLFARHGIDNTSLRAITAAAGANVAAVHYHFGSKDELLREIFIRRMTPLIEERLRRLEKCKGAAKRVLVEKIVAAYVEPTFEYDCSQNQFGFNRLLARLSLENQRERTDVFHFIQRDGNTQFVDALLAAAPHLQRETVQLRLELLLGMIVQALSIRQESRSGSANRALVDELINLGVAMMEAK